MLKKYHTRDSKKESHLRMKKRITHKSQKRITLAILTKDHTRAFLLSLRLLNTRQLRVSFDDSIFK